MFDPDATHSHEEHGNSDTHPEHAPSKHEAKTHPAVPQPTQDAGEHAGHAGGDAQPDHEGHVDHTGHEALFRRRFWVSLLLSIPVLIYSPTIQGWLHFAPPAFSGSTWITPAFATIIFLYGGVPFIQMAIPEVRSRQPGMMTLISLAICVAFIYSLAALLMPSAEGFFWELVTLIDIMLLGHWIELRSVRQASRALDELAKLMPDTAEIIRPDGAVETIPATQLKVGDLILVRPGASIPADGTIEAGESEVNEAMLTGESRPAPKGVGDRVIAGAVNQGGGSLRVRVAAVGEETALAGIMRLVREAQSSKSRTQVLADRAAGWLFYAALIVAGITAVAWTIAQGFNVEVISRVATVLVTACPHALGLAIPLVVAITTSSGARSGILIRDRRALEAARLIDTVIFDKTGTLTTGEFGVVDIATVDGWEPSAAVALAAAVEGDSEHALARAVRDSAGRMQLELPPVSHFRAIKGRGVQAQWDGRPVYVGGPRLLEMLEEELPDTLAGFTQQAEAKAQTAIYLIVDGRPVAVLALADVIRPESRQAIDKLHEMGISVAMLTGDSEAVARSVAEELQIDRYFAQVLPEDKSKMVAALQGEGRRVAMVGDGVNDAPALARADVGIAIGSGTDVAVESAGIILVDNDPLDVVKVIEISRASYRKMVQNLAWATGYNVIALPLAAGALAPWGILLSPAAGALLMSLSTVIVALNAQLLRRAI